MGDVMDNKFLIFKNLIEQRVNQEVTYANLPGLHIEAFSWGDYTFSIHSSYKGFDVCVYLFKDTDELGYLELPLNGKDVCKKLFDIFIVPNVPAYMDHVEINDCADNGYIGDDTWAVRVLEEPPFEQYDLIMSSYFITDTVEELDNQDTADFIGFSEFDQCISDADFEDNQMAWAEIDLQIALEQVGVV